MMQQENTLVQYMRDLYQAGMNIEQVIRHAHTFAHQRALGTHYVPMVHPDSSLSPVSAEEAMLLAAREVREASEALEIDRASRERATRGKEAEGQEG